jgi:hypothetical protein
MLPMAIRLRGTVMRRFIEPVRAITHARAPMFHPFWLIAFLIPSISGFSQTSIRHGTAIAIERTDDQIVIAADSRVVDGDGIIRADTCKIRNAGKWYFALNGLASTKGVDVFSVVGTILRQEGGIAGRSEAIIHSLTTLLNAAIQSDPALRKHAAVTQGSLLGVSIVGTEQNVLRFVYISFAVTDAGLIYEQHMCPGECSQNRAGTLVPRSDTAQFHWNMEPLDAVRAFVQMEIDRNLVDIGPPLQLLQINRGGEAMWIERPDVCKSVQNTRNFLLP